MTLNPPPHICGPINSSTPQEIRDERLAWVIAARDAGHMLTEISKALGLKRTGSSSILDRAAAHARRKPPVSREIMPAERALKDGAITYTRTSSPFSHREADVTLPRAPWDGATAKPDARPETAPPRGVRGHQHRMTVDEVVDAVRREWIKTRGNA